MWSVIALRLWLLDNASRCGYLTVAGTARASGDPGFVSEGGTGMSQGGQAGGEAICAARIGVLTDQATFAHVSASGRALGFAGSELALLVAYEHVSGLE